MEDNVKKRQQIETLWRERLLTARREYECAQKVALEAVAEWTSKSIPSTDGYLMAKKSMDVQRTALREYVRVIKIFHDLILEGKVPQEE